MPSPSYSSPVNVYEVDVTFNPGEPPSLSFGGAMTDRSMHVPAGIHMVVFRLSTSLGAPATAEFPFEPIVWLDGSGFPVRQPNTFQVLWHDSTTCTLVDYNVGPGTQIYVFNLVVVYDGKTFGSDPSIVNDPPVGGGP